MCVDETFGASQGCLCVYEKMSGEYLAFRCCYSSSTYVNDCTSLSTSYHQHNREVVHSANKADCSKISDS